jgi:hypothetical protein
VGAEKAMWLCFDPSVQACLFPKFPSSSSQGAQLFIRPDSHLSLLFPLPSIHRNSAFSPGFPLDLAPSTCLSRWRYAPLNQTARSSQARLKLVRYTLAVVFSNILHPLARLSGPRTRKQMFPRELLWNCQRFFLIVNAVCMLF